jgi:hypothetical protein
MLEAYPVELPPDKYDEIEVVRPRHSNTDSKPSGRGSVDSQPDSDGGSNSLVPDDFVTRF